MKRRRLFVIAALLLLLAVALTAVIWTSLECIGVTAYRVESSKLSAPLTAVLITDPHDHVFGEGNSRLIEAVRAESPDLILFAGDGLNLYSQSPDTLTALIRELCQIAPVYYSLGNHETRYIYIHKSAALLDALREAGAVVLDGGYADAEVGGQKLRIGGLYGFAYNETDAEGWYDASACRFLRDFEDTDAYKILLAHKPEHLLNDREDARWDIDLAVCGHEHGGQIRLPLIGGFYSTHLGFFSPYLDGAHLINGIPTVISRGLGTYGPFAPWGFIPPRMFNPPELIRIDLAGPSEGNI